MNNKLTASYTILSLWASGNWQRAIEEYFKLQKFVTPAMLQGREYHKKWADHICKSKSLPIEFGGKKLVDPICEEKMTVNIYKWLDLKFVVDCFDKPVIYEFKSGKRSSESYAGGMQLPIYAVGLTLAKKMVKKAELHHYDQYIKKHDVSYIWLSDKMLNDAFNYVVTIGGEIHNYFLQNGLYQRFGASRENNIKNA